MYTIYLCILFFCSIQSEMYCRQLKDLFWFSLNSLSSPWVALYAEAWTVVSFCVRQTYLQWHFLCSVP